MDTRAVERDDLHLPRSEPAGGDSSTFRRRPSANAGAAILGVWRSLLFVALGAGIIWAYLTNRLAGKATAAALIAVLVVDLWSIERMYWIFSPRASTLYATDPAIDAIKADMAKSGQPSRVWTEALSAGVVPRDPAFVGDALMSHDLRIVGNYHGNELGIYDQLLGNANLSQDPNLQIFPPPFWLHENIGYLYTGADDSTAKILGKPAQAQRAVDEDRGSSAQRGWIDGLRVQAASRQSAGLGDQRDGQGAGEPGARPRSSTRGSIRHASPSSTRRRKTFRSRRSRRSRSLRPFERRVTAASDDAYDISLDKPATAGSALVVSENYFPGWTATADGKAAEVARRELQPHWRRASNGRPVRSAPLYRCCVQEGEARHTVGADARARRVDRWCCSRPPPAVARVPRSGDVAGSLIA